MNWIKAKRLIEYPESKFTNEAYINLDLVGLILPLRAGGFRLTLSHEADAYIDVLNIPEKLLILWKA